MTGLTDLRTERQRDSPGSIPSKLQSADSSRTCYLDGNDALDRLPAECHWNDLVTAPTTFRLPRAPQYCTIRRRPSTMHTRLPQLEGGQTVSYQDSMG